MPQTDDQENEAAFDGEVPQGEGVGRIRAGYIRTPLLARLARVQFGWVPVDVDGPRLITGRWAWRNRRLSNRLWRELTRIGATKQHGADEIVEVAGEVHIGVAFTWTPQFLIGSWDYDLGRRVLVLSGTGPHQGETWSGSSGRLFSILSGISTGGGANTLWHVLQSDEGYARRGRDEA
jgi:hypothetical protein